MTSESEWRSTVLDASPTPEMATDATMSSPPQARVVTIVGAGLAGLTAAHELAERGFVVQVVEKQVSTERPGEIHVGGLAATQWGRIKAAFDVLHAPALVGADGDLRRRLEELVAYTRRPWVQTLPPCEADLVLEFDAVAAPIRPIAAKALDLEREGGGRISEDGAQQLVDELGRLPSVSDGRLTAELVLAELRWLPAARAIVESWLGSTPAERDASQHGTPGTLRRIASGFTTLDVAGGRPAAPANALAKEAREALERALVARRAHFLFGLTLARDRALGVARAEIGVVENNAAGRYTSDEWTAQIDRIRANPPRFDTPLGPTIDAPRVMADLSELRSAAARSLDPDKTARRAYLDDTQYEALRAKLEHAAFEEQLLDELVKHPDLAPLGKHRDVALATLRREILHVEIRAEGGGGGEAGRAIERARATSLKEFLFPAPATSIARAFVHVVTPPPRPRGAPSVAGVARLVTIERLVPGEHGFRFFPRHYKNVFDLTRRIPFLDEGGHPTTRTVHDGFLVTTSQALGMPGEPVTAPPSATLPEDRLPWPARPAEPPARGPGRHVPLSRTLPRNLTEVADAARAFFEGTGATPQDVRKFQLKALRFLTSSPRRRWIEYDAVSWREFVGLEPCAAHPEWAPPGWAFSAGMRVQIEAAAQSLLAYSVAEADAHSYGNFSMQTIVDQLDPDRRVDLILDGPTSKAWLAPWKAWLEKLGVRFFQGELTSIDQGGRPTFAHPPRPERGRTAPFRGECEYCVVALSPAAQAELVWADDGSDEWADVRRAKSLVAAPESPLRDMSGLQYYFETLVSWGANHVYYPTSWWGISTITQSTHWRYRPSASSGFLGIVSVDLADFRWHPREPWRPLPFGRTRLSLAAMTHQQIARATPRTYTANGTPTSEGVNRLPSRSTIPVPDVFHVDRGLVAKPASDPALAAKPADDHSWLEELVVHNQTKYLANLKGQFLLRPGLTIDGKPVPTPLLDSVALRGALPEITYQLAGKRCVLAGAHMATHTRMMTMEGSVESGMHAANAVLRAVNEHEAPQNRPIQSVTVHAIEDDEIPDLRFLRDLDDKLCAHGLPHIASLLEAERILVALEGRMTGEGDLRAVQDHLTRLRETFQKEDPALLVELAELAARSAMVPDEVMRWLRGEAIRDVTMVRDASQTWAPWFALDKLLTALRQVHSTRNP